MELLERGPLYGPYFDQGLGAPIAPLAQRAYPPDGSPEIPHHFQGFELIFDRNINLSLFRLGNHMTKYLKIINYCYKYLNKRRTLSYYRLARKDLTINYPITPKKYNFFSTKLKKIYIWLDSTQNFWPNWAKPWPGTKTRLSSPKGFSRFGAYIGPGGLA
jgi:hypothetical protein